MVLKSVCALDCPDACALDVHVDESGRATKLRGDPHHPITRGFLCGKVAKYLEREYHPDRLLYPMRRLGAFPKMEPLLGSVPSRSRAADASSLRATPQPHGARSMP